MRHFPILPTSYTHIVILLSVVAAALSVRLVDAQPPVPAIHAPENLTALTGSDEFEVLDRWNQVWGIGAAARPAIGVKVESKNGHRMTFYFDARSHRRLVTTRSDEADPLPQLKISRELLADFTDRQVLGFRERGLGVGEHPVADVPQTLSMVILLRRIPENGEDLDVTPEFPQSEPVTGPQVTAEQLDQVKDNTEVFREIEQEKMRLRNAIKQKSGDYVRKFIERAQITDTQVENIIFDLPALQVRGTKELAERLSKDPAVIQIMPVGAVKDEAEDDVLVNSTLASTVWDSGLKGRGVKLAILAEPQRIASEHPAFDGRLDPVNNFRHPDADVREHATSVAGVIASWTPTSRGVAPEVTLLSASRESPTPIAQSGFIESTEWALDKGAVILSMSQMIESDSGGQLNWSDIYADRISFEQRVLWVKSAGNLPGWTCFLATGGQDYVTSPGRGYNTLTVGAADTCGTASWLDDGIWPRTRVLNPLTGCDKPEVLCYGANVRLPFSQMTLGNLVHHWASPCGTSYAAPAVAGIAAICIEREPALAMEPETVKAMILAGAVADNLDGSADDGQGPVGERGGAGCVKATAALAAFHALKVESDHFDEDGRLAIDQEIELEANELTRFVLCYAHPPAWDGTTSSPQTLLQSWHLLSDLDLELVVDGQVVAEGKTGPRNPFEIIDYTSTVDKKAQIRIRLADWHPQVSRLPVGLAWISQDAAGRSPDADEGALPLADRIAAEVQELTPQQQRELLYQIRSLNLMRNSRRQPSEGASGSSDE